jgi:hypothetical protein
MQVYHSHEEIKMFNDSPLLGFLAGVLLISVTGVVAEFIGHLIGGGVSVTDIFMTCLMFVVPILIVLMFGANCAMSDEKNIDNSGASMAMIGLLVATLLSILIVDASDGKELMAGNVQDNFDVGIYLTATLLTSFAYFFVAKKVQIKTALLRYRQG